MEKTYLTGWVCPICGAVMNPTSNYCVFCTPVVTPIISYDISPNLRDDGCAISQNKKEEKRRDYSDYEGFIKQINGGK